MTPQLKHRIEQIKCGEVPAGYKKTKVGIVPEEWEEVEIGDVLTQRNTLTTISKDTPLLSFTIEEGVIDPENKKSNKRDFLIKDISAKKFALTEVGDIIYNPANIKFGAIHRNNLKRGVVSPIYGIFYGEQNSLYMGYLLHNQRFIDYAKIYTEGTVEKLKTLKADTFLKLKIALPSIEEQNRIVDILQSQDKIIELQQKKIDELKKLKAVYLSKMFPKKGQKIPEWRFKGFTDDWEQRKLGEISSLITKGTTPLDKSNSGTVNFVKIESIDDSSGEITITQKISLEEHEGYLKRSQLKENDILFSIAGTLGRVTSVKSSIIPANTNQALAIIRLKSGCLKYIKTYLKGKAVADYIKKNPTIGAQPNLSLEQVSNLDIVLPNENEQEQIGSFFEQIDNLITLHQRKLDEEKQKKKALMQLLLTGIVRV